MGGSTVPCTLLLTCVLHGNCASARMCIIHVQEVQSFLCVGCLIHI